MWQIFNDKLTRERDIKNRTRYITDAYFGIRQTKHIEDLLSMLKHVSNQESLRHIHSNITQEFVMPIINQGNRYDPFIIEKIYQHLIGGKNEISDIIWFESEILDQFLK